MIELKFIDFEVYKGTHAIRCRRCQKDINQMGYLILVRNISKPTNTTEKWHAECFIDYLTKKVKDSTALLKQFKHSFLLFKKMEKHFKKDDSSTTKYYVKMRKIK